MDNVKHTADFLQRLDEQGQPLGLPERLDYAILNLPAGIPFDFADGAYMPVGLVGNFTFAIQRVRKNPVHAEDVPPKAAK